MNVNELPQYKCHKVVRAGKISVIDTDIDKGLLIVSILGIKKPFEFPSHLLRLRSVEIGGYLVVYEDGYVSYSPAAAFEAGYSLIIDKDSNGTVLAQKADGTEILTFQDSRQASTEIDLNAADFSDALMWLKEGKRVQRAGWNGKGLWLEYKASLGTVDLPYIQLIYPVPGDGSLPYPNGARVPWAPSQTDMLADDWRVV